MENKEDFHYTYSAAQQQEIENIRKKYLPVEEDKMDRLCKLHRSAGKAAQVRALTIGVIGVLIMGCGMSLAMTDIGAVLGLSVRLSWLIGIPAGLVGIVLVALAYPVYNRVLRKRREKIAPQILQLTDELLK